MSRRPPLSRPAALRQRRATRMLANRSVRDNLISVAGLVGRRVTNQAGDVIGRVQDVVARWEGEQYPPITGLVVRVGRRSSFVRAEEVTQLEAAHIGLRSARVDLIGYHRRADEVALVADVMDHQIVDVDGLRVVRAADLYLTRVRDRVLLVGVDVGFSSLLRRLGPARFRTRPTPERVIDWATIQPFAGGEGAVPLRRPNQELHRLRPAELADLLEHLGRNERQELIETLEPEVAADALEEMQPEELEALLREARVDQAAELVSRMEPDEAADALRDLDDETRAALLAHMDPERAHALETMARYPERTAAGIMTTQLVCCRPDDTVEAVRDQLRDAIDHAADIDNVCVLDGDDRLLDDVSLFELIVAEPGERMETLVGPPWPVTVDPGATLDDVTERLVANRRSSLIVADGEGRPLGRILADDVVDALLPDRGRLRFPRILG
ncbi:MAG: magnesium transporter [Acidimicrobiia bacterium]|nr:magnesium transporter [Acidimicrobiia bacterium]